jgi:hypothetical protein
MSDGYDGRRLSKTKVVREMTGITIRLIPVTEESRRHAEETVRRYVRRRPELPETAKS